MKLKFDLIRNGLLVLLLVAFSSAAWAQRTVKGAVTDAKDGEALIGASILVAGSSTGTITDFDGTFELKVPAGATELEISYTGYTSQRVVLSASNVVNVQLVAGTLLDEVVVVGYGTLTNKEVTSAVTSVKAEDFNQGNVNDPIQFIQGKVAGLNISKPGNDPNGGTTIRLRGISTLGANSSPLVVIDGVIGAPLNSVDPNDIATFDVLKDGSAAAIYGTRASAGVIIITTKRGAAGKTTVDYNGYVTAESIAKRVPTTSAAEFAAIRPDFDLGSNTNWVDEVTRTGYSHVHNLSVGGGVGKTTYRGSMNFRQIQGVGRKSGFDQLNGRFSVNQKALNDRLTLGATVSATTRKIEYGLNETFRYATVYNPTAPVLTTSDDPNFQRYGGYYQSENFDYFNPVAIMNQNIFEGQKRDLVLSGTADYEIAPGLIAGASFSRQTENLAQQRYSAKTSYFIGVNRNGLAGQFNEVKTSNLYEYTLKYRKEFGSTSMNLLGGYSYQENVNQNFSVTSGNFISDELNWDALGASLEIPRGLSQLGSFHEQNRIIGFFGRANFSINEIYNISASIRRDGSSRLGVNNKWGWFPAISASANIGDLVEINNLDNLKLRVGYGETGSLPGESYLSQRRWSRGSNFFYNGTFVPSYAPSANNNPDLRWERKGEINAGIDFGLFDYKLTGSFDYFNRTVKDFIYLLNVPVPPNQASQTWANLDDVVLRTSGVELSIGTNVTTSSFTWEPNLVFSTFRSVLDTVSVDATAPFKFFASGNTTPVFDFTTSPGAPGLNNSPASAVFGGQRLGSLWGAVYQGVDENGQWIFEDVNGDGVVDGSFGGDQAVIGNGLPDFSLGINNAFKFGKVDFSFFFRGDFGHDLFNMYRVFYEPVSTSRQIDNIVKTKYFNENLSATPVASSFQVEDASFLTLDNATIGYTFTLPEGGNINKFRVYVTGQNLAMFTGYTGVDPSVRYTDLGASDNGGRPVREFNPNPLAPGLDRRSTYFRTRSFTLGVNVGF